MTSPGSGKVFDIGYNPGISGSNNAARIGMQVEGNEIDFWIKYSDLEPWGLMSFLLPT